MNKMIKGVFFLCFILTLSGCFVKGRLITHIVEPYAKDFSHTRRGSKKCEIEMHRVKEPISGYGLSAEWVDKTILDVARSRGIEEVHYIDIETFSVFFDIYRNKKFIIYGD